MLFSNLTILNKISKFAQNALANLIEGNRIINILYHFPSRIEKNKYLPKFNEVFLHDRIIIQAKVIAIIKPETKKKPLKIECENDDFQIGLLFFKYSPYLVQKFQLGKIISIGGEVNEIKHNYIILHHPRYVEIEKNLNKIPILEPIYPQTKGINNYLLIRLIKDLIISKHKLEEWINPKIIQEKNWSNWKDSIVKMHFTEDESSNEKFRKRLAYDELLAMHIIAKLYKIKTDRIGENRVGDLSLRDKAKKLLPFSLTNCQVKVIEEISEDISSKNAMSRILQGDVGSGKTIVAFFAILQILEVKQQAALMVPISLLAEQHFTNLLPLCQKLNISISILTGKTKAKEKKQIIADLKNGKIDFIIGTHALIYPDIQFQKLGLIVIDEQHRFGVLQRVEMIKKGQNVDLLSMSATPIPRSLMMVFYYDVSVSVIQEKPKNRPEIESKIISLSKINDVYASIERAIANGERIFWICPLIDESEESTKGNVVKRFEYFKERFGEDKVLAIYGKMKSDKKDQIMRQFKEEKQFKILIATTVIEVGIDIVDATVIFIENAESFGLSQLHQLRGRVGRGNRKSYNIMLYGAGFGEKTKERLGIIKKHNDGFIIAKKDLEIRGYGKIFGKDQSGFFQHKIADLVADWDLVETSKKQSEEIFVGGVDVLKNQKYLNLLRIFYDDEFLEDLLDFIKNA